MQQAIQANFVKLTENLSIQSLLDELLHKNLLLKYDYDAFACMSPRKQNQLFFLQTNMYSEDVLKCFIEWLKFNNQDIYNNIISFHQIQSEPKQPITMTPEYYRKHFKILYDTIDASVVGPYMYEKGFISASQLELIITRRSAEESTKRLLGFLDGYTDNLTFLAELEDILAA